MKIIKSTETALNIELDPFQPDDLSKLRSIMQVRHLVLQCCGYAVIGIGSLNGVSDLLVNQQLLMVLTKVRGFQPVVASEDILYEYEVTLGKGRVSLKDFNSPDGSVIFTSKGTENIVLLEDLNLPLTFTIVLRNGFHVVYSQMENLDLIAKQRDCSKYIVFDSCHGFVEKFTVTENSAELVVREPHSLKEVYKACLTSVERGLNALEDVISET